MTVLGREPSQRDPVNAGSRRRWPELNSSSKPPGPINTPARLRLCLREMLHSAAASPHQHPSGASSSAEPATVSRARRSRAPAASRLQCLRGHAFRQQEQISRARARQRGYRIHERFRLLTHSTLPIAASKIGRLLALTLRGLRVCHCDADAATDRGGGIGHCANNCRSRRQRLLEKTDGSAGHDRQD